MNTNTVTEDERTKPATKSKVKPIPDGMHAVTPHLICAGAADAIEFYKKAFDAAMLARLGARLARVSARWVPDPFVIALILTAVVAA